MIVGWSCGVMAGVLEGAHAVAAQESAVVSSESQDLSSLEDIERAITGLVPPAAQGQVERLTTAIAALNDATQQQRLQQLLKERLDKIAAWITPEASDEAIQQRLDALPLGTPPTDKTQDARDELLSAIMGITDGERRDGFIDKLKERERAAGTLIEAPTSSR